jgi:hypothetical protein
MARPFCWCIHVLKLILPMQRGLMFTSMRNGQFFLFLLTGTMDTLFPKGVEVQSASTCRA